MITHSSRLWEVPAGDSGSGAWPDRAAAQSYSRGRGQSTTTSPLFPLQRLQQEDHEYYPAGRQCGELLVLVRNIFKNTNSCDKVFVICCQICCWLLIFLWLSKCQESQYINQREISTFLTDFLMWSLLNSRLRLESPYSSLWQGSSSSSTEPTVFKSFSLAMCDVIISYHVLLFSL